jgi:hypothetical protein
METFFHVSLLSNGIQTLKQKNRSEHDLQSLLHLLQFGVDYKWFIIILASYTLIAAKTLAVLMMLQCFFPPYFNGVY